MQIDIRVVIALIRLRSIDLATLGNILHVPYSVMTDWLVGGNDRAVEFDTQLEALRLLGIHNETPRKDLVHYWRVREPLMGTTHEIYQDLITLVAAFGSADVVHLIRDHDAAITFNTKTHFGLRFKDFYALLEVHAHPLRNLRFNVDLIQGLEWVERAPCVAMDASEYDRLEPGSLRVGGLQQRLTYSENKSTWEALQEVAASKALDPAKLAKLVELAAHLQLTDQSPEDLHKSLTAHSAVPPTASQPLVDNDTVFDISAKQVPPGDDDDALLRRPVPRSTR